MTYRLGASYGAGKRMGIYILHKDGGTLAVGVLQVHPKKRRTVVLKATQYGETSGLFPMELDNKEQDDLHAMEVLNKSTESRPLDG